MRYLLIIVLVLMGSSELVAQAPGIVGRRMVLSGSMEFTPAIIRENAQNKSWFGADEFSFAFQRQWNLQAEYALTRRLSLRGGVYFPRTGFNFKINTPGITGGRDNHDIFYRVQGHMFSAMATFYKLSSHGNIAPKGIYSCWGLEYGVIRVVEAERTSVYANPAAVVQAPIPIDPRRNTMAFLFGFGNNYFLTDRLFIKGQATLRVVFFGEYESAGLFASQQTPQQRFQRELGERMFWHSFIMMQVGAGVALF
jgi:hypothetical protein